MWDLIVSVPDHCLSFYFINKSVNKYIFTFSLYFFYAYMPPLGNLIPRKCGIPPPKSLNSPLMVLSNATYSHTAILGHKQSHSVVET